MSKRTTYIIHFTRLDGSRAEDTIVCADAAGALGYILDTEDDLDEDEPITIAKKRRARRKPKLPTTKAPKSNVVALVPAPTGDATDQALEAMRRARRTRGCAR